jgi:hypothetical protein
LSASGSMTSAGWATESKRLLGAYLLLRLV